MKFGGKVRELRKEKGITQQALADVLGISLRTVIGYEKGETYPRNRDIYTKLAEYFGVSTNYLLTEDDIVASPLMAKSSAEIAEQVQKLMEQINELVKNNELSDENMIEINKHIQDIYWILKKKARKKGLNKRN